MIKEVKSAYYRGSWGGESQILLEYLRMKGVFVNGFTKRPDANPYAYGTILDFDIFETVFKST